MRLSLANVIKPTLAAFLIHLGTALLAGLSIALCVGLTGKGDQNPQAILYGSLLVQQILTLLVLPKMRRDGETRTSLLALGKPDPFLSRRILIRTGCAMLVIAAVMAMGVLLSDGKLDGPTGSIADGARLNGFALWIALPVAVLLAPLAEEMLFRGYLLNRLMSAGMREWPAMLLTGALFGTIHYHLGLGGMTVIGMGGVLLAYTRIKTGSIWPSVAIHAAWNGIIVLLSLVASAAGKV